MKKQKEVKSDIIFPKKRKKKPKTILIIRNVIYVMKKISIMHEYLSFIVS